MMRWLPLALLLLLTFGLRPLQAGPEGEGSDDPSVGPELTIRIERALDAGPASGRYEDLYRAAILETGEVSGVLERLAAVRKDEKQSTARRQTATWIEGHLLRRTGRLKDALERFARLANEADSLPAALEQAKLLDMLGRFRPAWEVWSRALPRIEKGEIPNATEVELDVRLRMALLGKAGGASVKHALAELATREGLDAAMRNRAAIVLALRGHPKEALTLFASQGEGSQRFREQVRLADWALAAKDAKRAQASAWDAQAIAPLKRDRRYALSVLVEAHRADKSLDQLIARFDAAAELSAEAREVWIDLLRETGRVDEALRLFREAADGRFTVDMRRELIEMCRESGDEDVLLSAYREMIEAQPEVTEWREGLSRHYLERGKRDDARAVWSSYLEDPKLTIYLLAAAEALQGIGLDDLAQRFAETSIERGEAKAPAWLFLFHLHKQRGRMELAEQELERFDTGTPADAPERMQLAEAYEQLGKKKQAVAILRALSKARGPERSAEDMEMRLAWLCSEVGDEDEALERWLSLWKRIEAVSRRRYVEDRLMTVASRLGKLADIAIELEEKLAAGTADARDSGLLTRLYTKAGDPISATEVIEEYMKGAGAAPVKLLVEKSRVFLACTDYPNYEKTIRQLIEVDPDGKGDYLRQLAMSQLERGKPDEARVVLADLAAEEKGSDSAEFEAGVLALAGLREEAVRAYQRGIARYPDRIESLLLMGALMAQIGKSTEAIGMLQHIAETADKDDLFMIAIDGLLNLDAPPEVLRWARRITLERLARRHDKMYLYQLIADLAEQTGDKDVMLRSLQGALPIIGERRSSLLRELMDHTRGPQGDKQRHLAYGRRLIGLGEVAPPGVYLDLGTVFLQEGEISNAVKTFSLATDVPDYGGFQQQVATAFETAGYPAQALRTWQRLLVSRPGDVGALLKVGELQEQVGRDDVAADLYARAMELMVSRRPLSSVVKKEEKNQRYWWWGKRNVDDFDQFYARVLTGLLTTLPDGPAAEKWLAGVRTELDADLKRMGEILREQQEVAGAEKKARGNGRESKVAKITELAAWPRLQSRAQLYRRASIAVGRPDLADDFDVALLKALPEDEALLRDLVRGRLAWGLVASARALIDGSGRSEEACRKLRFLVGAGEETAPGMISLLEANRLFLPLVVGGHGDKARALLRRLDFSRVSEEDKDLMPVLQSAALQMEDSRLALALGRHWIKVLFKKDKKPDAPMRFRPVLQRLKGLLSHEEYRSLCEYVVALILEDPKKAGYWPQLLPEMQRSFEKPLLDEEQRKALTDNIDGSRWYWIGSLFPLMPVEQRAAVLRSALPKVPNSQRIQFLLRLVDDIKEPIEGEFADFILESFEDALKELSKAPDYIWYSFVNLARGVTHLEMRLKFLEATMKQAPGKPLVRASRAVLLQKAGREEEGLKEAVAVLPELLGSKIHYTVRNARNALLDAYLPKHTEAFVAAIDEHAGDGTPTVALTDVRIDLVRRARDAQALLAAYRKAVQDHPKERRFKNLLRSQLSVLGYGIESLELVRAEAKEKPDDEALQKQLGSAWRRVGNPVEALRIARALRAKAEAKKGDEEGPEKRAMWVSPHQIQKSIENGELDKAAIETRRLWRRFQTGAPGGRNMMFFPSSFVQPWPLSRATDASKKPDPKRLRGGLGGFDDQPAKPEKPKDIYTALSEYDFGLAEMERELRTWDGPRLSSAGKIVDGLAKGRERTDGAAETVKALLAKARAGQAGKKEYGLLLSLFASAPDDVLEGARPILVDLERTLDPTDVAQLRRLARVWARLGDEARAARIYRWCGTRASAGSGFYFRYGAAQPVPTRDLVKEVGEVLKGEAREKTIEAILAFGDPGMDMRYGPHAIDAYEALVLETWTDLLGPDAAYERCKDICRRIGEGTQLPQRRSALLAAALLARGGETEAALKALESSVCKLEPGPGVPAHMHFWFQRTGRIGRTDVRKLLPKDMAGWKNPDAWVRGVAEALPRWVEDGRTDASGLFETLAIAAVRLAALGDAEEARALLPTLEKWAGDRAYTLLWVVDVARLVGDDERADALERRLFDEGRLNRYRVAEVVARIREREGADAALKAGEAAAKFLLHEALLTELVSTAEAAGKPDRAAYWKKTAEEAEAARETLKALDKSR